MTKDAKFFDKVQQQINKRINQGVDEMRMAAELRFQDSLDAANQLGDEVKKQEEVGKALEEKQKDLTAIDHLHQQINDDVLKNIQLTAKQLKLNEKGKLQMQNVKDTVDDLANKIRHPSVLAASILKDMGGWAPALLKANQEGKSFGQILKGGVVHLKEMVKDGGKLFGATGLLIGGVALAAGAFTTLFKLFTNYWSFLSDKVIPANADFNKQLGATGSGVGALKGQMQSAGVEFEQLGIDFHTGTQVVRDFADGLMSLDIPNNVLKTGKELISVLGLTGEEAGKLVMQFQKAGYSITDLNEAFGLAEASAQKYGIPVNQVLRDMGQSPEIMARFGIANRKHFAMATAKARSYGMTIKDITAAFAKQLDTFDGSAEAASKLNAIFGTTVNSFELMLETDPTKRMEMLRKALLDQGKSWEKLNVFERNVVTSALNVDEAQAALILSSEKERKSLEAKAREKENQIKVDEKWNEGLGSIKRTLIAWGPLLDNLMRSASNFLVRLFGGDSAAKNVSKTAHTAEAAIKSITGAIDETTMSMKEFDLSGGLSIDSIVGAIKSAVEGIKTFRDVVYDIKDTMWSIKASNDLVNKAKLSVQRISMNSGDISNFNADRLRDLREVEQDVDAKDYLVRHLRKYMPQEKIDDVFKKLYSNKVQVTAPQKDAYIHKSGKIVPIAEDDNIIARKDMKKVNEGQPVQDNSELLKTIANLQETIGKLASAVTSSDQKIVLTDINGAYIGKGLVQKARGR
jgi:hypothetical protein